MEITDKTCSRCRQPQLPSAFAINRHNRDGRESQCKACKNSRERAARLACAEERARRARMAVGQSGDESGGERVKAPPAPAYAPAIAPVVSKTACGCPVEVHKGIPYKMCQPASCQALGMNQLDGIQRGYRLEPPA